MSFLTSLVDAFNSFLPGMADNGGEQPAQQEGLLFAPCSFAIVRSATLSERDASAITQRLELHGGEVVVDNYPDERLNLEHINYIIATNFDFPDYHDAIDRFIHVVKPPWIDVSLATNKCAHPRRFSPDPHLFLSDVVATCADLPESDAEAIAGGILAMGGNYSSKLSTQVTHIVALSMENDVVENAVSKGVKVVVVLPHWIDDCLKLGKKIDEGPYKLPDPEVLRSIGDRAPLGKVNKHIADATNPDPQDAYPNGPTLKERRSLTVLKNKRVFLDKDLGISQFLAGVIDGMFLGSHGKVVDKVEDANMAVCKYRDGSTYITASLKKIDVGNLSWLFYLIVHDIWTSPFRRLLHYPISRQPLKGFENLKISLSNYSGEARTYLENLIKATGAECTKTLKQENTHLITAHTQSEKVAAAKDWNINVVNHLWLEESYAKWKMQTVSNPRYVHFPKKTNLGEVVGQTHIDREVIETLFLPKQSDVDGATPRRKALPTMKALEAANEKANKQQTKDVPTSAQPQANGMKTPATSRFAATGKENTTPTTTGSRKSKDAATAKIHGMSADIALFEKEKKRVGGVTHGRSRGDHGGEDRSTPATSRKRSIEAEENLNEPHSSGVKKQKTGPASTEMRLLISGYKKWIGKAKEEDADIRRLRELGIAVVTDPSKATHLAVPHIVRTAKFVCALAYAPMIVSTDFIDACLEKEELLDAEKFKLKDKSNEKRFGVSLSLSTSRARENQQKLLQGRHVFCVEKVHGGFETYQAIVEANGGVCTPYRGRHTTIPSTRSAEDTDDAVQEDDIYLISSDSKEDSRLWSRFVKMAESSRRKAAIVKPDWLLDTAMCQVIRPTAAYELKG